MKRHSAKLVPILTFCGLMSANTHSHAQILTPSGSITGTSSTTNVGIGPLAGPINTKLIVSNTLTSPTGIVKLANLNGGATDNWWLGFSHGTNTTDAYDRARIGIDMLAGGAGRLYFTTGYHNGQAERMRINEIGNVGIATNNPTEKLDVWGNGKFFGNLFVYDQIGSATTARLGVSTTTNQKAFDVSASALALKIAEIRGLSVASVVLPSAYDRVGLFVNRQEITGADKFKTIGTYTTGNRFGLYATANQGDANYDATGIYAIASNAKIAIAVDAESPSGLVQSIGVRASASSVVAQRATGVHATAASTEGDNYGVYTETYGADNKLAYGVYSRAVSLGLQKYAVYADAFGGSGDNFGIYARSVGNNSASYAGVFEGANLANAAYFNGAVLSTAGPTIISDQRFKENVTPLSGALDKIMKLTPKSYTFKKETETDHIHFKQGINLGFIAQELEEVFPEVVNTVSTPAVYDENGKKTKEAIEFKGVEYTALIPVLVAGMKEQQNLIIKQQEAITALQETIRNNSKNVNSVPSIHTETAGSLMQNEPNPFDQNTVIRYQLNSSSATATLIIYDMNGTQLKSLALDPHNNQVTLNGNDLKAGIYYYTLIANGKELDTKRMILTR